MANDEHDRTVDKVFGDMDPAPGTSDHLPGGAGGSDEEELQSANGGSQNDPNERAGVGTETGGTRNYRQGSGATGGDVGNRPEVYKPK